MSRFAIRMIVFMAAAAAALAVAGAMSAPADQAVALAQKPAASSSSKPAGLVPTNALLKMSDPLRIIYFEDHMVQSDFFNRREMPVVRLVAEKPATR